MYTLFLLRIITWNYNCKQIIIIITYFNIK